MMMDVNAQPDFDMESGTVVDTHAMFAMMMADMGLSTAGIPDDVVTNMIDEIDAYATTNGFMGAADLDGYISADTQGRWVR